MIVRIPFRRPGRRLAAAALIAFIAAGCSGGGDSESTSAGGGAQGGGAAQRIAAITPRPGETIAAGLAFTIPSRWVSERPSSAMRLGQYRIPSTEPGVADGEVTLFHFGVGRGGDAESNLARWAGQFQQEDGSKAIDHAVIDKLESNSLTITTIEVNGRYVSSMPGGAKSYNEPGWRLMGGIIEGDGGPWFFKAVGPEKVITGAREEFLDLLRSGRTG